MEAGRRKEHHGAGGEPVWGREVQKLEVKALLDEKKSRKVSKNRNLQRCQIVKCFLGYA